VTLQALVAPHGRPTTAFIRFGGSPGYAHCSGRLRLPATRGEVRISVLLTGLLPHTAYHFQAVASSDTGTTYGRTASFTAPSTGKIAPGVAIGPILLGGDTRALAIARLRAFLAAPLRFTFEGAYWSAPRTQMGAELDADTLVARALAAKPDTHMWLALTIRRARLDAYLAQVNTRFERTAQNASIGLVGTRAVVEPARTPLALDLPRMRNAIRAALDSGLSERLRLIVATAPATNLPPAKAVVVRLGSQTLTAYLNGKPVVTTPVTTGRPALPTPIGSYHVYLRASPYTFISPWPAGSPYWYPPTPVTWAIEFYEGDFLHNDPGEPSGAFGAGSQDGPYASHGCVHVPYSVMAFLWSWLPMGSQVVVSDT
jgi:hypothetical protein